MKNTLRRTDKISTKFDLPSGLFAPQELELLEAYIHAKYLNIYVAYGTALYSEAVQR